MSTTSMAIFSNPLFATYSVYARNASIVTKEPISTVYMFIYVGSTNREKFLYQPVHAYQLSAECRATNRPDQKRRPTAGQHERAHRKKCNNNNNNNIWDAILVISCSICSHILLHEIGQTKLMALMYAERDIVLPIPSVCPMPVMYVLL